ncbi:hypothetical protein BH09GEM1_BH09GEM1_04420 [soil metagenome]
MDPSVSRVTIIMPVHNGERYLAPAMESMLGQTYADFEFLILDDGSTDGTAEVLQQFARRDARITIFTRHRLGLTKALNELLAAATGEYVARMDADDISLPGRLATEVAYLDEHPDVGLVSGNYFVIDQRGHVGATPGLSREFVGAQVEWALYWENPIVHPSVMFRTALVRACGGYPEGHSHYADDYALWFTVAAATRIAVLHEPLLHLRKHDQNVTVVQHAGHLDDIIGTAQAALAARIGYEPSNRSVRIAKNWPVGTAYSRSDLDDALHLILSAYRQLLRADYVDARELDFVDADLRSRLLQVIDTYSALTSISTPRLSLVLARRIASRLRRAAQIGTKAS